jgi:hypothetical protein
MFLIFSWNSYRPSGLTVDRNSNALSQNPSIGALVCGNTVEGVEFDVVCGVGRSAGIYKLDVEFILLGQSQ